MRAARGGGALAALRRADRGQGHRENLSDGVRRAGAGARPSRHGGARRRVRLPGRAVGLRQEHPAAAARRSRPRRRRHLSLAGQRIDGPSAEVGVVFQQATLLPWLTVWQNVTAAAPRRRPSASATAKRGARSSPHRRPARLREQISLRAVRRHAAARRHRAGAGARSEAPADGRAVRRARRAHPREDERRAAAHLARQPQDRGADHPFDRRGGVSRRPRHRDVGAARPHHPRSGRQPAAPAHRRRNLWPSRTRQDSRAKSACCWKSGDAP